MIEALIGAVVGAVAGALASWAVTVYQLGWETKRRVRDAQFDLVRQIVRCKAGPDLAAALNEVPVLFAQDDIALDLYRDALPNSSTPAVNMSAVADLLAHVAESVGLPTKDRDLLERGFDARR
ncbi:hypothetical protein ACF3NT_01010 [Naumannella halotolerans]|uniref:hypothetical protein n=1 Tax=Naumannella halotolerans TaxID=993414 RepID=UPI001061883F|nr:hypothetical protein [Naumannella halotolerans]